MQTGFTLLEVLLALVLMALAMVGIWGALRTGARLTRGADAEIQQADRVRAVQGFLRGYLGGAQPQGFAQTPDQPARMFEGDTRKLSYVAPMPAQLGDGGLFVQTLQLVRTDDGGEYELQMTYAPLSSDTVPAATSKPELLLDHVANGGFEYLFAAVNGKPAQWRDSWHDTSGMPLAVRIALKPGWGGRIGFPEMVIPLRAGNGSGLPFAPGVGP